MTSETEGGGPGKKKLPNGPGVSVVAPTGVDTVTFDFQS